MLFQDTVGNIIEIVKRPNEGKQFDYLWTARYIDAGPGKGMKFSFDSGDIGTEYFPVEIKSVSSF